jgi:adenylate cyclase
MGESVGVRYDGDPLGSRLLRDDQLLVGQLRWRVQIVLTVALLLANAIGVVVVASLSLFVIPGPSVFHGGSAVITYVALPIYIVCALVVGTVVGTRVALRDLGWFAADRLPTATEAEAAFGVPRRLVALQLALWALGVVVFTVLYGLAATTNLPRVAFPVAFGGIVVCANSFLLSELALRPVLARALSVQSPNRRAGVKGRTLLAWGLGSAVPVIGLMTVAVFALTRGDITVTRLSATVLALGGVILAFGFLLMELSSRAIVAPIRAVRAAFGAIAAGDLSVEVAVDDGTELGELQSGFNDMAAGLREREQIRELFGRHVGYAVAAAAMDSRPELGGEERHVAVLFVDIVGSTTMAENRPAAEVVDLLNRFFEVVVEVVEHNGGLINKFIGDAALAVFGAPTPLDDAAGSALRAAREVVERLDAEVPDCAVGAAVASGTTVAGNIGARRRFEYTVIGDPVNEAARLSDIAKADGGLVASEAAVNDAGAEEQAHWTYSREEQLRGRTTVTRIHRPRENVTS